MCSRYMEPRCSRWRHGVESRRSVLVSSAPLLKKSAKNRMTGNHQELLKRVNSVPLTNNLWSVVPAAPDEKTETPLLPVELQQRQSINTPACADTTCQQAWGKWMPEKAITMINLLPRFGKWPPLSFSPCLSLLFLLSAVCLWLMYAVRLPPTTPHTRVPPSWLVNQSLRPCGRRVKINLSL